MEQYINRQLGLGLAVYRAELSVLLLAGPGISSSHQPGLGSLLANTSAQALHWLTTRLIITREQAEAARERVKVQWNNK